MIIKAIANIRISSCYLPKFGYSDTHASRYLLYLLLLKYWTLSSPLHFADLTRSVAFSVTWL